MSKRKVLKVKLVFEKCPNDILLVNINYLKNIIYNNV